MDVLLKLGDIFFTRGTGLFSRAIRVCTRSFGEKRSKVNYVGVVVREGDIRAAVVCVLRAEVTAYLRAVPAAGLGVCR